MSQLQNDGTTSKRRYSFKATIAVSKNGVIVTKRHISLVNRIKPEINFQIELKFCNFIYDNAGILI